MGRVFLPFPHLSAWSLGSFCQLNLAGIFEEVGISAVWGIAATASLGISEGKMDFSVDMGAYVAISADLRISAGVDISAVGVGVSPEVEVSV